MTKSTLIFVALFGLCCGAPPLDISEFFATPTSNPEEVQTAPVPESKARLGSAPDLSELLAKLGGDQNNALRALATMLGNPHTPDTNADADDLLSYFGQPDLEKEPEDIITDATVNCRTNSLSKADCEEHQQCHWLAKSKNEGKCIHQTERLYNALYKKLNKRGKKDIAIQVFYNSRPAKVKTPNGLHGPHIVGAFNHLHKLQPHYKPIGYNSHLNSYGYGGYNHYGYGGNRGYGGHGYGGGYGGHGYGGYGGNRGYGQGGYGNHGHSGYGHKSGGYGHDDGGYDNKNDTSSHDNGGYEQENNGYGHDNGGYGQDKGGYGNDNGGYGQENNGYGHDNGGYGQDKGGYGHSNGGYSHEHNGYGQGYGGYGHGNGGYGHSNGGYGHSNGGYGHNNGGYGGHSYGNGGHGHDNGGYGGGHGHSEYSGPSYGHQGHSAGYSAVPTTYGSKGHGGYE